MMSIMPDIQTCTVCRCKEGENKNIRKSMTIALQTLVDKYPTLRGQVVRTKRGEQKGQIEYSPGVIDLSQDQNSRVPSADSLMFRYIESTLTPLQPPLKVNQRAKQGLMEVQLILLVTLCHCSADGTTYYQLVDELCYYMTTPSSKLLIVRRWIGHILVFQRRKCVGRCAGFTTVHRMA